MSMSILDSIIISLFCIALVFVVLACLFALIKIQSSILIKISSKISGKYTAKQVTETADTAVEDGEKGNYISAGELKLINVDEKTAAIIMAIVSDESGIPVSELQFKSIKAVD